jgi:hypothetical protein|tara:strand:+ start:647 stop:1279 length:633 start_codon:yes stop_codon:yes gene_type:complete
MWYSETESSVIKTPRAITVNGIQHPSNIFRAWSEEELEEIAIYSLEVITPDYRYYNTGAENLEKKSRRNPDGTFAGGADYYELTYDTTEKNVDNLKSDLISKIKTNVGVLINPSDWMVIRATEGGTAMSANWTTYRSEVRAHGNSLENGVEAFASVQAVKNFQNHEVQEERKVSLNSDETEIVNLTVDKTYWGWPESPDAVVNPYHVRYI